MRLKQDQMLSKHSSIVSSRMSLIILFSAVSRISGNLHCSKIKPVKQCRRVFPGTFQELAGIRRGTQDDELEIQLMWNGVLKIILKSWLPNSTHKITSLCWPKLYYTVRCTHYRGRWFTTHAGQRTRNKNAMILSM